MNDSGRFDMASLPILTILGATGCGKSRLGIQLAQKYSGEIISADSMQVYQGLDIITAKVTKEERAATRHHMLDVVDPLSLDFTVTEFRNMAIPIIDNLLDKKKLPIIVGGTNYYIESLLWRVLLPKPQTPADHRPRDDHESSNQQVCSSKRMKLDEFARSAGRTNQELFQKLTEVDPEMAKRVHPNNTRKVIRSLEVFEQHGVRHSELLKAQRTAGGCGLGGPPRYPNSVILWLRCDRTVLEDRLERRIDDMLENGLVQELLDFHRRYNEQRIKFHASPDYTRGIFQSIGLKEFHDYLVLPEKEKQEKKGEELLKRGIADLKLVTNQYSKKQEKWIRNRLIRRSDRQVPPVYELDCTNVDQWDNRVYEPAVRIVDAVLRGEKPQQESLNATEDNEFPDSSNMESHYCDVCERIFIGELQWNIHLQSNKHMKVVKKKRLAQQAQTQET